MTMIMILLYFQAKCKSMGGSSPSQVLPLLISALEAERVFRPYGRLVFRMVMISFLNGTDFDQPVKLIFFPLNTTSDYITSVLQWLRFPNLKTEEKDNLKNILDDLSLHTYGISFDRISALLDNAWT